MKLTTKDVTVVDPFAGSGSTLIAAANLGRKAYGFEISKRFYVDACDAIKKNVHPDMFAMQESKYYKRQSVLKQAVQTELNLV